MPLSFRLLLAPPQSLETLDAWGAPDRWPSPWSFDSVLWQRAAVWGMEGSAVLRSSASCVGGRVRTSAAAAVAFASAGAQGCTLSEGTAEGRASSGGNEVGGVARALPAEPAAGRSAEACEALRMRLGSAAPSAFLRAFLQPCRIRLGTHGAAAFSVDRCAFVRLRLLDASGKAASSAGLSMETKGRQWLEERMADGAWIEAAIMPVRTWSVCPSAQAFWTETEATGLPRGWSQEGA